MPRPPRNGSLLPRGRGRRAIDQPSALGPQDVLRRGTGGRGDNLTINDRDRRMENVATVSRSSGLEKDGDSLKEPILQEEFRTFIDKKLKMLWDLYGASSLTKSQIDSEATQKRRQDNQENILILFRKLREGLFASGRKDSFALEVYETSLYLSVIFDSPVQTTSILSRLVPDIYSAVPAPRPSRLPQTMLILLLHQLVIAFPSQQMFLDQIRRLVPNLLERPSAAYLWISTLAQSLRTLNFVQFERLSHPDAFEHLFLSSRSNPPSNTTMFHDLSRIAINVLVSQLRLKARDGAWIIVRNAYRELSSSDETQMWLGKRLFFDSFGSEATVVRFDEWVREKCREGQLRPKEGVEGRWLVCKAR